MPILVTRPQPDNAATTAALRAKGLEVLPVPMLRFEPVAFQDDADARYGAVINATTGRRLTYGELSAAAARLPVPQDVPLKDPKDPAVFRILGRRIRRLDIAEGIPLLESVLSG